MDGTPAPGLPACLAFPVQVGRGPAEAAAAAAHCRPQPPDRLRLQVGGLDLMGKEMWGAGQRGGPPLPCSPSRWQPLRRRPSCRGSGRQPGGRRSSALLSRSQYGLGSLSKMTKPSLHSDTSGCQACGTQRLTALPGRKRCCLLQQLHQPGPQRYEC